MYYYIIDQINDITDDINNLIDFNNITINLTNIVHFQCHLKFLTGDASIKTCLI